ncbi:cytochrome P450 [Hyaloscypha variabilis F]|uniref:Cytochrome P450 n=1 Tax=Hyaloscypha variabilis (strain UAMH 11265 / GT02V1 / F) TaxID=1149755 RepID=A0A2J6S4C1_HYAVF|nr:cytochrome P450 [Hyaloscypha variabilis F]
MSFQEFFLLLICLFAASWVYSSIFHTSRTPRTLRGLQQCRETLRASTIASRAAPNQQLVEVFNIDNALTTINKIYHAIWVRRVRDSLKTHDDEWNALAIFASNLRRTLLLSQIRASNDRMVDLPSLVQSLVFRVVLQKFFPGVPQPLEEDVHFITARINALWLATKIHCSQADSNVLELKGQLETRLRKVFQASSMGQISSKANRLNIIIPAYESLWRVVLRCFLEVRFRNQPKKFEEIDYSRIFSRFISHPNPSVFEAPFLGTQISIKHVVNEALRLYPPTRRIHRQLDKETVKIDVEWLHRDPVSWGRDAEAFRPERWEGVLLKDVKGKMAFMPFGLGDLSCPAKKFAPMMIGVLVAALMGGVGEEWEVVDGGVGSDVSRTRVLDGGREVYAGLRLRKVEG